MWPNIKHVTVPFCNPMFDGAGKTRDGDQVGCSGIMDKSLKPIASQLQLLSQGRGCSWPHCYEHHSKCDLSNGHYMDFPF